MHYSSRTYGDSFADVYDTWYAHVSDAQETVTAIAELAKGGLVLELGVGSGRLAAPLAARGVGVIGIDASQPMLVKLPPNCGVHPVLADMAALPLRPDAGFAVIFVAFNTLFNLTTAAEQQACIAQAAQLLHTGGSLLIEAFVPGFEDSLGPDKIVGPANVASETPVMTSSTVDPDAQLIIGEHLEYKDELLVRRRPWQLRYATPKQLDEMARHAGLTLADRHADWIGSPFDDRSDNHVSRYTPASGSEI